jgi:membrane associated rhomboid family serine protease
VHARSEYCPIVSTLPSVPTPAQEDEGSLASPLGRAAALNVGFLAILWVVELINAATGRDLTQAGGIVARDFGSLVNILTAPFVHANIDHLMGNALPLFSLGLIAAIPSPKRFLWMTLVVIVVGGLGIWLTSPAGTVTIGASGVVFGYFSYLLLRGLVDRRPADVLVSIGIAIAYGSYMWSAVGIGSTGVSWQGHVSGLVGGVVAAIVVRTPRKKPAIESADTTLPGLPPTV